MVQHDRAETEARENDPGRGVANQKNGSENEQEALDRSMRAS